MKNICQLVDDSISKFKDRPAMGFYYEKPFTYFELGERIKIVGQMLKENGIRKGDHVAIAGENCPNWAIAYLSIVSIGAVVIPILPEFTSADIINIIKHSDSKLLFATKRQMEKICYSETTLIKKVIMLDDFSLENCQSIDIYHLQDFIEEKFDQAATFFHDLKEKTGLISTDIQKNDLAAIIYTSGTTGFSKGVMLTHENIVSNIISSDFFVNISFEDRFLSILPLSHAFECTLGFLLALYNGSSIFYIGSTPTPAMIKKAACVIKPTVLCIVPLIIEKIYKKRILPLLGKNILMKSIVKVPLLKKILFKKAVKEIIHFLGGEVRLVPIGGAPLNRQVEKFLKKGNFPYVFGYGLTEASPLVTGEKMDEIKIGSPGYAIPGVEIKIDNPDKKTKVGDILIKGPNITIGYYKNKKISDTSFTEDGWFITGDRGIIDKDGFLFIKGRSKNMLLGPNGENIYPETIEDKINSKLIVQESLVIENRGDIEALVYLDPEILDQILVNKSEEEQETMIRNILLNLRNEVNDELPVFSKIKKCLHQIEPFKKTATHKIKRFLYYHPGA